MLGVSADLAALSMLLAMAVAIASSYVLIAIVARRLLPPETEGGGGWFPVIVLASLAVALGPGSLLLTIARPDVANEAIAWGCAWTILTLVLATRWAFTRSTLPLVAAAVTAVLAANSRPSFAFGMLAIGVLVVAWAWRFPSSRLPEVLLGIAIALLPIATSTLVFLMKFGSPTPDMQANEIIATLPLWREVLANSGGAFFGPQFIPTHGWGFLRPTALDIRPLFPRGVFLTVSPTIWPVRPGGAWLEPTGSLTTLAPSALLLSVVAVVAPWALRSPASERRLLRWGGLLTLAAGATLALTWMNIALVQRYLLDALPAITVGAAFGAVALVRLTSGHRGMRVVLGAVLVGLTLFSTLMVLALPQ
jgi:hypothetical protein